MNAGLTRLQIGQRNRSARRRFLVQQHDYGIAHVVRLVMASGHVTAAEVGVALNTNGTFTVDGSPWTVKTAYALLKRLVDLGAIEAKKPGPLGSLRYSTLPRARPVDRIRAALVHHADDWALGLRPVVDALRRKGKTYLAIAQELNRRRMKPQRSALWTEKSVRDLMHRLNALASR